MSYNDFVNAANKNKAKPYIYGNYYLDQWFPKGNHSLKININSYDKQSSHPIDPAPAQNKANPLPDGQSHTF